MPELLVDTKQAALPAQSVGTLPQKIILGAILGIVAGTIFGPRTAMLQSIGNAYGAMLQIAVFPYILCSLMYGLGRLHPATAQKMLRAGWLPFLFLWILTFSTIWLLAFAIPPVRSSAALAAAPAHDSIALIDLLIPSNPFTALRKNYVPAVVIFAVLYGIALQKIASKQTLLEVLNAISIASVAIWNWVVKLAPFGVFALLATTTGTVRPDRLIGLIVYMCLYLAGTAILALLVIPITLSAIVPESYRELLRKFRPAMVLGVGTTLSVAALPLVQKAAESVLERAGCPASEERSSLVQTSLSLSYVFAQLGNLFVYLLILYSSYEEHLSLTLAKKIALPVMTLLSCLGSPSATYDSVDFLSGWLHLPSTVFNLYVETSAITRFGQVLLSISGFSFVTVAIPLLYFKKAQLHPWRFLAGIISCAALCTCLVAGATLFRNVLFPAAE